MRQARGGGALILAILFAISAFAADQEKSGRRDSGYGCCRNWQEDPALSGASRPGVIHGGFLPVFRGGCWRWWYDQWVWVC